MKKNELNIKAKAEIKKIRKDIENSLIDKLKTITAKLGGGTDNLEKEIEKGSRKLAKKISKELKPDQLAVAVTDPKIKPEGAAEPKVEKKPEAPKPAPKEAKAAPAKQIKEAKAPVSKTSAPKNLKKGKDTV